MKHPDPRIEAVLQRLISPKLATIDLSLDRICALLHALGNPQEKLPPVVHVAGTNGKGSLVAYLTAIVQSAGYRVNRYISPHLIRFNERILLCGREIDDEYLLTLLARVEALSDQFPVTFFEATTAAAFLAFAETDADIVLLETGLGGRLDATNMVGSPLLTCITPVSIDHTEYLGNTIAAIAAEKAGIIKKHVPCVVGPQLPEAAAVIEQAARDAYTLLYRFGKEWQAVKEEQGFRYRSAAYEALLPMPGLTGSHQVLNAGTAIACVQHLEGFAITEEHILDGLLRASWPARLQKLTAGRLAELMPLGSELWLDGGHNPGAGEVLSVWAQAQEKPVHLICGMLKNKDTVRFLTPLAPYVSSLTAIAIEGEPLGQLPEAIASAAKAAGIERVRVSLNNDIKNLLQLFVKEEYNDFIILICGSLYLAGNILWQNNRAP